MLNKNDIKNKLLQDGEFLFETNQVLASIDSCSTCVKYDFIENTGKQNLIEVYGLCEEQFVNYDRSEEYLLIDDNNLIVSHSKEEAISMLKSNIDDMIEFLIKCVKQEIITFDLEDKIVY